MLKGTRDGILKKVQPVSIHGQVSWDVYFTDVEDPDGQPHVARVGPEAVVGRNMEHEDESAVALFGVHAHSVGIVDELAREIREQFGHYLSMPEILISFATASVG